ncbi:extracellular solute-binding protein [Phosphitispora sp. TUW77]|uniref:extracellular solute-binding protein n=1 Tax=Phosphitispora sp. TUW77 TaxID=3152361 RepID=UPI003AB5C234
MKKLFLVLSICGLILSVVVCAGCQKTKPETSEVIIYTSVDQIYSEQILKEFEEETGIKVKPAYDVEAAKTTGLVQRLIAEKNRPRADVFWSGEVIQTIRLKEEGVLASYHSPEAVGIPETFLDPEGYWTGFAGRARIIIVNTDLVPRQEWPSSVFDLIDSSVPGNKIGIAMPMFGTTSTHAAALYSVLGDKEGKRFFEKIKTKGIAVLDGNSLVRDQVAQGRLMFGLTDTDDACQAVQDGLPVQIIFPDQEQDGLGTFVIPNTVAMIKGAPHPEQAKKLIDFLVSKEAEQTMVEIGWSQFPVRPVTSKNTCLETGDIHEMEVDYGKVFLELEKSAAEMRGIFVN